MQLQFDLSAEVAGQVKLELNVPLWNQRRASRIDVRELSNGVDLATHAELPLHRCGLAAGEIQERLALRWPGHVKSLHSNSVRRLSPGSAERTLQTIQAHAG